MRQEFVSPFHFIDITDDVTILSPSCSSGTSALAELSEFHGGFLSASQQYSGVAIGCSQPWISTGIDEEGPRAGGRVAWSLVLLTFAS